MRKAANEINVEEFLKDARPKLAALEDLRLDKLQELGWRKKIGKIIGAVGTPLTGFIDFWLITLQSGQDDPAAGVTILFGTALYAWVTKPRRDYKKAYKNELLPDIAGLFGEFVYDAKGKIPMSELKPSKIIPRHNVYESEDMFIGNYKGVEINLSEIRLARKAKNSSVTVFQGLAILLTHGARKFYGHTILVKDKSKFGEWFKKQTSSLKRANMVDPEFENMFDVFTNDQTESRYLFNPLIIESLKKISENTSSHGMMVAFYNDNVLLLVGSSHNHFEPAKLEVSATNEKELITLKREFSQVLDLVDKLSLYDPKTRRRHEAKKSV